MFSVRGISGDSFADGHEAHGAGSLRTTEPLTVWGGLSLHLAPGPSCRHVPGGPGGTAVPPPPHSARDSCWWVSAPLRPGTGVQWTEPTASCCSGDSEAGKQGVRGAPPGRWRLEQEVGSRSDRLPPPHRWPTPASLPGVISQVLSSPSSLPEMYPHDQPDPPS